MTTIYAFGSNGSGQLALGHKEDVSVPEKVHTQERILFDSVNQLKAGGNHTLLLAANSIYCSGIVNHELSEWSGIGDKFVQMKFSNDSGCTLPIVSCAASWEAILFVQQDKYGRSSMLYTVGTGNHGELGHGPKVTKLTKAQLVEEFPPFGLEIKDLAACVSHAVAVLSNGDVYGWGNGRKGQIGETKQIVYRPRKITGLGFKIVRAVCGREFTCLFGDPEVGHLVVLGSDKWNLITAAPKIIPGWKDIGAGWGSIHVLMNNGNLVSWGRNDHGQLAPTGLPKISQIAVGSEHTLGLTVDGNVLAWGWGEHGNCGPVTSGGDVERRWNIITASGLTEPSVRFTGVGAGCATSWIFAKFPDT
ncbi:RCC1 repeat-containing protein C10F6.04 [Golovinomyces cichoracearum]|uniref:RCC1 repeat-containing protein C10F6.04 n=1 Tax=Golovinomyces cichoracearum TaxID=62708 RepID=A0A420IP77_9PEZI|nr:RCC1 repeat-containing protein C10F6.04 [Golovinomyces cichoracearum]